MSRPRSRLPVEPFSIRVDDRCWRTCGRASVTRAGPTRAPASMGAGHRSGLPAAGARLLGRRLRLACAGTRAERFEPLPRRARRRPHPLRPRSGHGAGTGIPLILTHGWPSTFVELLPLVPLLTDPQAHGIDGPAFDVVIPSLPGYGFSERPARTGVNYRYVAGLWHRLMRGLGYERYGARGGDFGAGVATFMALDDPAADDRRPPEQPGDLAVHRPGVAAAVGGRARLPGAEPGNGPQAERRLQRDPVDQAADARVRAERLAGRAGRLDSREVAVVDRFRR